jgi:hypothetical protein
MPKTKTKSRKAPEASMPALTLTNPTKRPDFLKPAPKHRPRVKVPPHGWATMVVGRQSAFQAAGLAH